MSSLIKDKKRISVRSKIFIGVGLFVILNIILNFIIVKVSINDIYLGLEKKELKNVYKQVKNNINNEDEIVDIIYSASDNGMKVKVLDENLDVVYSIFNDKVGKDFTNLDSMLLEYINGSSEKFIILKNYRKNGYDLHYVGYYNGNYIIVSSSIASLKKDARTAIVVLLLSSILVFIILLLVAYYISKLFGKKINEIKEVTENISNLKFDKKIENPSNDEIGDLLCNINKMSDTLQEQITELESANVKLKNDLIEKEKQEEARKKLIANISHEFKTPLTIISGYSQLLLDDVRKKEDKENVELIISESERLSDLVHEFLELSRLESGNIKLEKENVDMPLLIEKEIKKMKGKIEERKISLSYKHNNDEIINVDKKQITKVIENVLTNAIKFCKNDNKILIKTYTKDDYYVYEVFNTGDQIIDTENIFNSYYKEKSTRNKKGTGLGLTIVKAIVDLHEGICDVKNVKNGVKFIIKIKKES